jgi:hypothetical protein
MKKLGALMQLESRLPMFLYRARRDTNSEIILKIVIIIIIIAIIITC